MTSCFSFFLFIPSVLRSVILFLVQTVKPFSLLAQVYDAIMSDVDYDAWAAFILETAKASGWQGRRVLDLGCGTGNSSFPFYVRGYEVTGLDASAEMLAVARDKLPPVNFVVSDFSSFHFTQPFDLVVSLFDSLNNLLEPSQFLQTAQRVHEHLTSQGMFIFDVNTTVGLRDLWELGRAEGWSGEVYYRWEHSYDEHSKLARVEAYCSDDEQEFTEVHYERSYDPAEIHELLTQAGFTDIRFLAHPDGGEAEANAERVWVVASKQI